MFQLNNLSKFRLKANKFNLNLIITRFIRLEILFKQSFIYNKTTNKI